MVTKDVTDVTSLGLYVNGTCTQTFAIPWQSASVIFSGDRDISAEFGSAENATYALTEYLNITLKEVHDIDIDNQLIFCTTDGNFCQGKSTWFLLEANGYPFTLYLEEEKTITFSDGSEMNLSANRFDISFCANW